MAAHPRLREHAATLDGAARACEAVARIFDDGDPHTGVYHLLADNELALLDRDPSRAGRANALAFRLKLSAAAGFKPPPGRLRLLRRARAPGRLLGRRGRRRLQRLRGQRVPARRRSPPLSWSRALFRSLSEAPDASPRALAQAERAIIDTLEHHADLRLRPVGTR